jgi:hypothetical protein
MTIETMTADRVRDLLKGEKLYHTPRGKLTLVAYKAIKAYQIWVWTDEDGNEFPAKVMKNGRTFAWSTDYRDRFPDSSFTDANRLPRV